MREKTPRNRAVAEHVARRMAALGARQAELAERSGLSDLTIRRVERGEVEGRTPAVLQKFAIALGWTPDSIDRILAGDEPIEVSPSGDESPDALLRQDVADLQLAVAAIGRAVVAAGFLEQATLDGLLRSPGSAGRSEQSAR